MGEEYPVQHIIRSIMFVNGDNEFPSQVCVDFITEVVHEQMTAILDKARALCKIRKTKEIGYTELIFIFRRHPTFIKRLISYMRLRKSLPTFVDNLQHSSPSSLTSDFSDSARLKQFAEAVALIDVYGEFSDYFDSDVPQPDEIKLARLRRTMNRVKNMDHETYLRYTTARAANFCLSKGRRTESVSRSSYWKEFLEWLSLPNVQDRGIAFVLNFCATEIVATLVHCALLFREQAEHRLPDETCHNGEETPSLLVETEPLRLYHYKEVLHHNAGFATRNDILFGDF